MSINNPPQTLIDVVTAAGFGLERERANTKLFTLRGVSAVVFKNESIRVFPPLCQDVSLSRVFRSENYPDLCQLDREFRSFVWPLLS